MGRIVNRRNAMLGWAVWMFMRRRAKAHAKQTLQSTARAPRRGLRRLGRVLVAGLAAVGVLALWRKLRGGGEDEWTMPDALDLGSAPAEPSPLASLDSDDDIPPAA